MNPSRGSHELYVANGDSDTVSVISTETNIVTRTFDLAPYAGAAEGSNPNALAVSPDGGMLYVANAGNNDLAVISHRVQGEREEDRPGDLSGMIPTAWYPTGVSVSPNGRILYIENAKVWRRPQPERPQPDRPRSALEPVRRLDGPRHAVLHRSSEGGAARALPQQLIRNNGFDERDKVRVAGADDNGGVIPRRVGGTSPIKHVIYVVKENRTYQVFGSLGRRNGDPNVNLLRDEVAPNIRTLAASSSRWTTSTPTPRCPPTAGTGRRRPTPTRICRRPGRSTTAGAVAGTISRAATGPQPPAAIRRPATSGTA